MAPCNVPKLSTIREALLWASSFLAKQGCKDPRFEAELLLRHVLGMSRATFLASMPDAFSPDQTAALHRLCVRRSEQEPIQYLLGSQEFYGREFDVRPGVLIPRPETEILVEQILLGASRLWGATEKLEVADIGTGSGAIALTLACERPNWLVTTIDISPDALSVATANAKRFELGEQVRLVQGDLAEPLLQAGQRVDIFVSNPPYIPTDDVAELDREVRAYEPLLALDGGEDGLSCYRRLCNALPSVLKETALVGFEVGIHQADDVAQLLQASGVIDRVDIIPDLAGIDRVVIGYRGSGINTKSNL